MRISTPFFILSTLFALNSDTYGSLGYFDLDLAERSAAVIALKSHPSYEDQELPTFKSLAEALESCDRLSEKGVLKIAEVHNYKNIAREKLKQYQRDCEFGKIPTPIRDQTLPEVQENFRNTLKSDSAQKSRDLSSLYDAVEQTFKERMESLKPALDTYTAFLKRYGSFRSMLVERRILSIFDLEKPLQVRQAVFDALSSTGFIKNIQTFDSENPYTFKRGTFLDVTTFLKKHGPIEELGLGDGVSLSGETCEILGIHPEADCAARPFGLEDMESKALRLDLSEYAMPHVVCDMRDADLYKAIQTFQGPGSLSKIADRSWFGDSYKNPETLNAIALLLKSGGVFELWDVGSDADLKKRAIIMPKGFSFQGYDDKTKILQFKKI